MKIKKSQELIDRIRDEMNLSKDEISDDKLWKNCKNSFMCEKINLRMTLNDFKNEIVKAFGIPEKYLGKYK